MLLLLAVVSLLQAVSFGFATEVPCDPLYIICGKGACSRPSNTFDIDGAHYSYSDFNAIAFGDLNIDDGDTEGRLAVMGSFSATNKGVSFGDKLSATSPLPYSLIVGDDLTWTSTGRVHPDKAGIFVGGTVTADQSIENDVTGSCAGVSNCQEIDSEFNEMKSYFVSISTALDAKPDNADSKITNQNLAIDCLTPADVYFISIDTTDLSTITSYSVNCPPSASFVFNVRGTAPVTFKGSGFARYSTVYNIPHASTVTITNSVHGSILAPNSQYIQNVGLVTGQTVASEYVNTHQVNMPQCPPVVSTTGSRNGGGVGDPMIIGFHQHLRFWFNGWVGGVFNLYNDEYLNANSRFTLANAKNGTVMEAIAVEVGGHQITFDINFSHDNKHMNFILDGKDASVTDKTVLHLDGCVEIGMKPGNPKEGFLSIRTPMHEVKIKLGHPTEDGYITIPHLDFLINPPKKNHHLVGGVIGQTATGKSDRKDTHFDVSDLFGVEKSQFFKKTQFKC